MQLIEAPYVRNRAGRKLSAKVLKKKHKAKFKVYAGGRPPRTDVDRSPGGKSLAWRGGPETEKSAMETALAYREKNGIAKDDAASQLAGSALGQMRLCGIATERAARKGDKAAPDSRAISDAQHRAGESWASLCRRYEAIKGIPSPNPRAADFNTGGGRSLSSDPDPEYVTRTKSQYARCWDALAEAARSVDTRGRRPGWDLISITYAVCCQNRPFETLSDEACGNIRAGLNAIGRVLG